MKTIGIFCGGYSSEYEISIKSATTILNNFPDGYNAFLIVVSKEKWTAQYKGNEYQLDLNTLTFDADGDNIQIDHGLVYIHGNPGENGKIQAQGEDVKEILVDGKPFFGNDPAAALKNLPAEVIDKIQIFDRQSDQDAFSGFNSGQTTKSINIIKKAF